jgi:hypothetical protein
MGFFSTLDILSVAQHTHKIVITRMSSIMKHYWIKRVCRLCITSLFVCLYMFAGTELSSAVNYKIGKQYGGGIIFYVDRTGAHGLIAANADIRTTYTDAWEGGSVTGRYCWSTNQYDTDENADFAYNEVTNTGTALGQGAANTSRILAKYPADTYPNSAAAIAHAYRGGGYSDWFLPSKNELNQLFLHKDIVGGFAGGVYWSSSEINAYFAWVQGFVSGSQSDYVKNETWSVRPVRAF